MEEQSLKNVIMAVTIS